MIKNIAGSLVALGFIVSPALVSAQGVVAPTLTLTASKTSMSASVSPAYTNLPALSWASTNATSCTASGTGWSGATALSGTQKVNPPVTTTYTMKCVGSGGSVTRSVVVSVISLQTASVLGGYTQATNNSAAQTIQTKAGFTYTWNRNVQIGSPYTADVSALQTALTQEGVYSGEITGGFYSKTSAAVKLFQKKYAIDATGFVGPITRAKLNALYGN